MLIQGGRHNFKRNETHSSKKKLFYVYGYDTFLKIFHIGLAR